MYPNGYLYDTHSTNDLVNATIEWWLKDSRTAANGGTDDSWQLVFRRSERIRWWSYLKITHFSNKIYNAYAASQSVNRPAQDQSMQISYIKVAEDENDF